MRVCVICNICSVMKTVEQWVEQQSPAGVVDVLLDKCLSQTTNMIQQNTACKEQHQLQTMSSTPALYLSLSMSPQSFLSVQLFSSSKTAPISSASLLTLFAANMSCNSLYKLRPLGSSPGGGVEEQSSLSSTISCPVVQLQIVTLNVSNVHTPTIGSNKLGFMLKLPGQTSRIGISMRQVLEVSISTISCTVVGTIKNVVTPNVLSPSASKMSPVVGELPSNTSRVAVILQIKEVWLQVATPLKNTPHDLVLVCIFASQWSRAVSRCGTSVMRVTVVRGQLHKQVMAQLMTILLQQDGEDVPDKVMMWCGQTLCVTYTGVSITYRVSSIYCTMCPLHKGVHYTGVSITLHKGVHDMGKGGVHNIQVSATQGCPLQSLLCFY